MKGIFYVFQIASIFAAIYAYSIGEHAGSTILMLMAILAALNVLDDR